MTDKKASGGLFGQGFADNKPATFSMGQGGSGMFGGAKAAAPSGGLFGKTAPAPTGGLFGQTDGSQNPMLLGGDKKTNLFGSTNTFGGAATEAKSSLFGGAPTGNIFGGAPKQPAGNLFGNNT